MPSHIPRIVLTSFYRAGLSYSLASNHLADWTEGERRSLRGRLYSPNTYNGGQPFQYKQLVSFRKS